MDGTPAIIQLVRHRAWILAQAEIGSFSPADDALYAGWKKAMGSTFTIKGFFWVLRRLYSVDPRVIAQIYANPDIYAKSKMARDTLSKFMRAGPFNAEGERHRLQRKVAAKLFSGSGLRRAEEQMGELMDVVSATGRTGRSDADGLQLRGQLTELSSNASYTTPYTRDDLSDRVRPPPKLRLRTGR